MSRHALSAETEDLEINFLFPDIIYTVLNNSSDLQEALSIKLTVRSDHDPDIKYSIVLLGSFNVGFHKCESSGCSASRPISA